MASSGSQYLCKIDLAKIIVGGVRIGKHIGSTQSIEPIVIRKTTYDQLEKALLCRRTGYSDLLNFHKSLANSTPQSESQTQNILKVRGKLRDLSDAQKHLQEAFELIE